MSVRLTVQQVLDSRIPHTLGECGTNLPAVCSYLNEAIQRLILAAPDTGWWNQWAKVAFNVPRDNPHLTLPPQFAIAAGIDVCRTPVAINNEWYEFLEFGIGLQTDCTAQKRCAVIGSFDRGMVPTAFDLTPTNQKLRAYVTDPRDVGRKILFSKALDQNGNGIYEQDGLNSVDGAMLTLASPFVGTDFIVTSFAQIVKDETYGDVVVKQVDNDTGAEVLLARIGPDVTIPQYRRYLLSGMPCRCCPSPTVPGMVQVTAMCKYEFVPVKRPTDVLLFGNLPALKAMMESVRYGEQDNRTSQEMSVVKHAQSVRSMSQELAKYVGQNEPAVNVAIFGSAKLEHQMIGTMV